MIILLNFQVTSHEPIYIQIRALGDNPLLKFVTESCYATPTPDLDHPTRYLFFTDRCAIDTTFQQYVVKSNVYGFSIDAFTFIRCV